MARINSISASASSLKRRSQYIYIDSPDVREWLAEFVGTAILIIVGNGSVAQFVLSRGATGNLLSVHIGYGLAVAFGVFVSGGVSGGHLNPVISFAMVLLGRLQFYKCLLYSIAQYFGAIFGSGVVYAVYYDALNNFDGGIRQITGPNGTAGIFATYPQSFLSLGCGLGDQIVSTSFLTLMVLALTDKRNLCPHESFRPIIVGLVVVGIGMSYGFNSGYAMNPARDLGPRIFTACAGWGVQVFRYDNYRWFWIPIIGPYIGAMLGTVCYQLTIGLHWPKRCHKIHKVSKEPGLIPIADSTPRNTSEDINTSLEHMDPNENDKFSLRYVV